MSPIEVLIASRVVAHQHLAEGRVELFDVAGEVRAVLEIELVLAALLRRASGDKSLLAGVAENGRAELLIDQDAGTFLRHSACHGSLEGVVDHLFDSGNLRRLFRG